MKYKMIYIIFAICITLLGQKMYAEASAQTEACVLTGNVVSSSGGYTYVRIINYKVLNINSKLCNSVKIGDYKFKDLKGLDSSKIVGKDITINGMDSNAMAPSGVVSGGAWVLGSVGKEKSNLDITGFSLADGDSAVAEKDNTKLSDVTGGAAEEKNDNLNKEDSIAGTSGENLVEEKTSFFSRIAKWFSNLFK